MSAQLHKKYGFGTSKQMEQHLDKLANVGLMKTGSYNVGSSDYAEHLIQPWNIMHDRGDTMSYLELDIVKRMLRNKGGIKGKVTDLNKCKHIIDEILWKLSVSGVEEVEEPTVRASVISIKKEDWCDQPLLNLVDFKSIGKQVRGNYSGANELDAYLLSFISVDDTVIYIEKRLIHDLSNSFITKLDVAISVKEATWKKQFGSEWVAHVGTSLEIADSSIPLEGLSNAGFTFNSMRGANNA